MAPHRAPQVDGVSLKAIWDSEGSTTARRAPAPELASAMSQRHMSQRRGSRQFGSTNSMRSTLSASQQKLFMGTSSVDLLNNETAKVLRGASGHDYRRRNLDSIALWSEALDFGVIDWSQRCHMRRLQDLRLFVRRLFQSIEVDVLSLRASSSDAEEETVDRSRVRRYAHGLVNSRAFSTLVVLLIIYALYGPDMATMYGYAPQDNFTLATVNTCVLFLFATEVMLNCSVSVDYNCTGRFWVDLFATVSMIGDTLIVYTLMDSNVAAAGRGSRLMRMLRMSRSSRLMRLVRISRTVQVLRLVPRLLAKISTSSQHLTNLLLHKRLWHIFLYLDTNNSGTLTEEGRAYFHAAMVLEFSLASPLYSSEASNRCASRCTFKRLHRYIVRLRSWVTSWVTDSKRALRKSATKVFDLNYSIEDNSFEEVMEDLMRRPESLQIRQSCQEDVDMLKDSSHGLEKTMSALLLKICMAVICLIVIVNLLQQDVTDTSMLAGLVELSNLAMALGKEVSLPILCGFVRDYGLTHRQDHSKLLLLTLNFTVFLHSPQHAPCQISDLHASDLLVTHNPVDVANEVMGSSKLEAHEFISWCYPHADCSGTIQGLALFDFSHTTRAAASDSLVYTTVAVLSLVSLVSLFSMKIRHLTNESLMHPLWNLLDDMCSMKCMEVAAEGNIAVSGPCKALGTTSNTRRCKISSTPIAVAEELKKADKALKTLKRAMRSWVKYVPSILFTQLFDAGIEFGVGCCRRDVTVLFCDVKNFQDLCIGLEPRGVLELLSQVLDKVTNIVEDHDGQMLEFIGDEILAVFNAPVPLQDHSAAALMAAVRAHESMRDICHGQDSIGLQIGVHRAHVLAGNLGSVTRMKYGVLGDGVNQAARIKSLNTRFGTSLLATASALDFEDARQDFVVRPVGNLVLKGRKEATMTYEVLGLNSDLAEDIIEVARLHQQAFDLYLQRNFRDAKVLFMQVRDMLADERHCDMPSHHMAEVCEQFEHLDKDLPADWDGSEHLTQKVWIVPDRKSLVANILAESPLSVPEGGFEAVAQPMWPDAQPIGSPDHLEEHLNGSACPAPARPAWYASDSSIEEVRSHSRS